VYMSRYYTQNIVPKQCARDYVNMCAKDNRFNADRACSNVKDL
jgi:hypothetical protein